METAIISHITSDDYLHVYEPAEDSFLLIDALEKDLDNIKQLNPLMVAEIGSGSGVVITSLAVNLKAFNQVACFATDINTLACKITKNTALKNTTYVETLNMDLLLNFRKNIFDIIIFNPPYVVTDSKEIVGHGIERSWAGGIKGREIIDRFLEKVPDLLTDKGIVYLLVIEENDPNEIGNIMKNYNLQTELIVQRKIRGEFLSVLKFFRRKC